MAFGLSRITSFFPVTELRKEKGLLSWEFQQMGSCVHHETVTQAREIVNALASLDPVSTSVWYACMQVCACTHMHAHVCVSVRSQRSYLSSSQIM